jgi:hypothetical protein
MAGDMRRSALMVGNAPAASDGQIMPIKVLALTNFIIVYAHETQPPAPRFPWGE